MLLSETNPQDNLPKNYFNDMKDVNRKDEVEDETEKKKRKMASRVERYGRVGKKKSNEEE